MNDVEHTRRLLDRLGAEVPIQGKIWAPATTGPGVWTPGLRRGSGSAPADYLQLYISLDEYVELKEPPEGVGTAEAALAEILDAYDRRQLLAQLAYLSRITARPNDLPGLTVYYRQALGRFGPALDHAMTTADRETHVVARQQVLAATRELLRRPLVDGVEREQPTLATSILLAHAAGSFFDIASRGIGKMLCGYPAHLLLELARNATLYEQDDPGAMIARTWTLWREYEPSEKKLRELGAKPKELLREATGMELEGLMAMGFAAFGHLSNIAPGAPILMSPDYFAKAAETAEQEEAVLRTLTSTPDELREALEGRTGQYDFLAFQSKPILRTEDGFLVLDGRYLLDKFTSRGLYWIVHDYLKFELGDENRRARWNEAHAQMVEKMVEEQLRSVAPGLPGSPDRAFYGEEELAEAYAGKDGSKVCDAAVDYGDRFLLFEVVDRQLTHGTRVEGNTSSFERDTRLGVVDKCRQLDATGKALLKNPQALTKSPPVSGMKVVPVLIVAGGYPNDPLSRSYADEMVKKKGLLQEDRIEKLGIVNLAEVEMLEALAETRHDLAGVITDWKNSSLGNSSLWNYLIEHYDHRNLRSRRIQSRVEEVGDALAAQLGTPRTS